MWALDPPSCTARSSWETCTSVARDTRANDGLGTRLRAAGGTAEAAADTFGTAAASRALHTLAPADFKVPGIPDDRVVDIAYLSGMLKGPGRTIYETLMAAPEDDLCPLCRHSDATELDHVLPKQDFPALCVAPQNLVPVCGICNHTKSSKAPAEAEKVLLHPYYEHTGTGNWLHAAVVPDSRGRVVYSVVPPAGWTGVFTERVRYQFAFLELDTRYRKRAGQTLRGFRRLFADLLATDGPDGLRDHLVRAAGSHLEEDPNHWKGVAYRAWAADDAFCAGSFDAPP